MEKKLRVAGYVKLAKLWERRRAQALEYHTKYYAKKYSDSTDFELVGVYIDITVRRDGLTALQRNHGLILPPILVSFAV